MQVRKIKEKKAEKRTRNEPSTSSSSGSPERSGEGDEAKNKKQVGNKKRDLVVVEFQGNLCPFPNSASSMR